MLLAAASSDPTTVNSDFVKIWPLNENGSVCCDGSRMSLELRLDSSQESVFRRLASMVWTPSADIFENICFSYDNQFVAADGDGIIVVWNVVNGEVVWQQRTKRERPVTGKFPWSPSFLHFSQGSEYTLFWFRNNHAIVRNGLNGETKNEYFEDRSNIQDIYQTPQDLVVASHNHSHAAVRIISTTGKSGELRPSSDDIIIEISESTDIALVPSTEQAVTARAVVESVCISVWDIRSGTCIRRSKWASNDDLLFVDQFFFSTDRSFLFVENMDGIGVTEWQQQQQRQPQRHHDVVGGEEDDSAQPCHYLEPPPEYLKEEFYRGHSVSHSSHLNCIGVPVVGEDGSKLCLLRLPLRNEEGEGKEAGSSQSSSSNHTSTSNSTILPIPDVKVFSFSNPPNTIILM